jgi:SET domain-containing protein
MSSRSFRVGRSATGLGLFATRLIKRAAYIATYRGPRVAAKEAYRREHRGSKYLFELNSRWMIDGSPRWNVARYINHSCRPNAEPVVRKGRIVIVAKRSIPPGEEITYDYGREYFDFFIKERGCRCSKCSATPAVRRTKGKGPRKPKKAELELERGSLQGINGRHRPCKRTIQ